MQQVRLSVASPRHFVARRRFPASRFSRRFHLSRQCLSSPSHDPPEGSPSDVIDNRQIAPTDDSVAQDSGSSPTSTVEQTGKPVSRPYGSALRRAMRNKSTEQQKTLPTAILPSWFADRNTISRGSAGQAEPQQHQVEIAKSKDDPAAAVDPTLGGHGYGNYSASGVPTEPDNRYAVAEELWDELRASIRAGLQLPPAQYAKEPSARKSHLVLQYPGSNGIPFLDAVVQRVAHDLNTDLITLNAQDLAQLLSEQDLAESGATSPIRSLGYEVHRPNIMATWPEADENDADGDEDMADIAAAAHGVRAEVSTPRFITIEANRDSGDVALPNWLGLKSLVASINGQADQDPSSPRGFSRNTEQRWIRLLDEVLSSVGQSAKPDVPNQPEGFSEVDANTNTVLSRDTVVHIQDYREIQGTREGARVIGLLQKVIQDRRREGSRIVLIGSTSQELRHAFSQDGGSRILQNVLDDHFSKTLVLTPAMESKEVEKTFLKDQKKRTMDINIRHLQTMLRYRLNEAPSGLEGAIFRDRSWPLGSLTINQSGIADRFWSYNQVHWVATLALGSMEQGETFGFEHIRRGIELMDKGDRVTSDWLQQKSSKSSETIQRDNGQGREQLLSSLRKTCNQHEKKLLNGVVDVQSIRTTFADVHVPPETIDALKTLTSLSLVRPEAFTYGVLATDKIPGLLLYGPPGTGKTLLAKAVARESGATVLEVSGSEIYDMYVGEGEKNVKAIFTLAKKLSPCVVFIDEADAIFCSRTGASNRSSHRELINQFLREWDGMSDMSAFIMVATNRPFDLDDAVLRRLPRRLLVDLPTEKDRLEILKIHLKEEIVDSSVDLAELARRTPLYSGSDLKNLSVAAALACVRQEIDAASQHKGDEPYNYPARRTLTNAHFERGMEEISASISEDMSSLSAIRKFDEQYGDRKGRREKSPGWGFIPAVNGESAVDTARVRT
ncbi:uncharacterized protein N7459_001109 [Penicillium hispanicum]|uniref:uncharacterized protein n=1 Tax=Penicillium hispanicum TaxID=1080232 RepID=UPI002541933E|nr:uncharacterized protein N7459_001109 [Penicillium hispanicum]KAJ5594901.1 hypothetical protein N7459_001109 [Penicillium hispanicum]